jgi:hypothetical protein
VNKSRGIASRRLFNKQKKTSNLPTKKQPAPRQFFSPTVEGGIFQKREDVQSQHRKKYSEHY